jgi:hypothetical protein
MLAPTKMSIILSILRNAYNYLKILCAWPKSSHVYANTCDTKDSFHFNLRTNTPKICWVTNPT